MATKKPAAKKTPSTSPAKPATSLVLRTCAANMRSHDDFLWPEVGGEAVAPDWIKNEDCGNGLHGWLYGAGDHSCSSYLDASAKWLVVEVESASIVMLVGKCKFPRGLVRFVGNKKDAADFLIANEPRAKDVAVIGTSLVVGDEQSATVGALGTATAGYRGTATAGDSGEIRIRYWDNKAERYRTVVGYPGENGIEPNVAYVLDERHQFVKAEA